MIEKARTFVDKELRRCFRNKQHAVERNATEAETSAISEKISVLEFLLRCLDTVEQIKEERDASNV